MATTVTLSKLHYGSIGSGAPNALTQQITYGEFYSVAVYNYVYYIAYVSFDFSACARKAITQAVLTRARKSFINNVGGAAITPQGVAINAVVSADANYPDPVNGPGWTLTAHKTVGGTVNIGPENVASGPIVNDITAVLTPAAIGAGLGGIVAIAISASDPNNSMLATDSDASIQITYDDILPLAPANLSPNTAQNPRLPILFSWQHRANPALAADDPQTSSQIQYRVQPAGGAWGAWSAAVTVSGAANSYTLPANTISGLTPDASGNYGNLQFQARTGTQYNGYGAWASQTVALAQTPPLAPTLVFPTNNITVPQSDSITFEWVFNSALATVQGGFELDMQVDGVQKPVIAQTTVNNYYTMAADGMIHDFRWRVRTSNALGDMGAWSGFAAFHTVGLPAKPSITNVTNQNRPLVTWGMMNGLNWQLQMARGAEIVYDSGVQPELAGTSFRLPVFLPIGAYTAMLRSVSDLGLYSDWALFNFAVNMQPPLVLSTAVMRNDSYGVTLSMGAGDKVILRDGVQIAETADLWFTDYTGPVGIRCLYVVRYVVDYNYGDSKPLAGYVDFIGTFIAPEDDLADFIALKYQMGGQPGKSKALGRNSQDIEVIGRAYPLTQYADQLSNSLQLSYFIRREDAADARKLEEWSQRAGFFWVRSRQYGTMRGKMSGFSADYGDIEGVKVQFTISQR